MCWRICIMQYKDVIILLCLTIFKICKWKFLALDFQLEVCLKGTRDVISSDLPFMEWHVHCPVGVINIVIEPTAHRKSLRFHRKATKKIIFYFNVIHHFLGNSMLNSNLKSILKNWKLRESELKNSSKTLKSLKIGI